MCERGRIQASKNSNPKHRYNAADRFNSYAETGVYFQTLMDASKNAVPLDYLKVLFGMSQRFRVGPWCGLY
jgi:hypothetical protein